MKKIRSENAVLIDGFKAWLEQGGLKEKTVEKHLWYEDPLPDLVTGAKFRGRLNLVRLLGQCLARELRERAAEMPELILPVPLHAGRLRERGYNQALEIARVLGRELAIPVDRRSCVRVSATPPQAGLARRERRRNVRGAFRILRPLGVARVVILALAALFRS